MKTALILPPTAASFEPVAGLPLIQRTALSALRCGFDRVVVLSGAFGDKLRGLFAGDPRMRAVEVSSAPTAADGSFVAVIPSDLFVTAATLQRLSTVSLDGRPLLLQSAGRDSFALCRPAMLADIDIGALAADGADKLWTTLRRLGGQSLPLEGNGIRISDARSVAAAEQLLCAQVRAASAASDGPLAHWIDRHISLRLSRWLVRHTRLRPNHLTVIGTSMGLLAALILSGGTYWAGVAGTLLFLCTTIVDGCDGEVARLTFRESAFGEKFDVITDNIVHVAIFAGLALGLYRQNPGGHYAALFAILLGGFACDSVVTYFFLVRRPGFARSGGPAASWKGKVRQALLRGFEALMNRDFAYLLLGLAVAGRLHWFLWGTAFGTYLFAILLVCIYRWRDAA